MWTILAIIFALYLAFRLGWYLHERYVIWVMTVDPKRITDALKIIDQAKESVTNPAIELDIERVNNQLYAYVKTTGQYISRGVNLEAVLAEAHDRFPSKKFFGKIETDNPAKDLA
jgi:hypothetical protein